MTDEARVIEIMDRAKRELGEYCNAVLIVVSFDKGEDGKLLVKSFGPPSHGVGLAHYAIYEAEKSWDETNKETF